MVSFMILLKYTIAVTSLKLDYALVYSQGIAKEKLNGKLAWEDDSNSLLDKVAY